MRLHEKMPNFNNPGKCKSNPELDITLRLSEWLKSTTQGKTGVGEEVKRKESSWVVGENANWCSQFPQKY